jgi:hypothetical protein
MHESILLQQAQADFDRWELYAESAATEEQIEYGYGSGLIPRLQLHHLHGRHWICRIPNYFGVPQHEFKNPEVPGAEHTEILDAFTLYVRSAMPERSLRTNIELSFLND